jgi:hypothetical protein
VLFSVLWFKRTNQLRQLPNHLALLCRTGTR